LAGMGWSGCVNIVKRTFLQLPDITEADVQLNPQRAVLTMSRSIDIEELQAQLKKTGH